jgi:hypothetical protein
MNVKEHLAGRRGLCVQCQTRIDIPALERPSTATAVLDTSSADGTIVSSDTLITRQPVPGAIDPIAEAPHLQWYVGVPGANQPFGPADGEMLRGWMAEGRVTEDAMLWREDWPEWRRAADVFSTPTTSKPAPTPATVPTAVAAPAIVAIPVAVPLVAAAPTPFTTPHSSEIADRLYQQQRSRNRAFGIVAIVILIGGILALAPFVYSALSR